MIKNVRKAVFALLRNNAAVSNVVQSGAALRIYPIQLPQGILSPSLVYNLISENTDYHMQGSSGLVSSRIQIDAWAPTQAAAFDLADLVKDVLSGFHGTVTAGTGASQEEFEIRGIFGDSGRDSFDATAKMFAAQRDYLVWYAEF